jgi:hypothetical protein
MFDDNRRVRAMNLRGVKSEGFWCPLSYLDRVSGISAASIEALKVGDTFSEIDGIEICRKYLTKEEIKAIASNRPTTSKKLVNFPEHVDTEQWRFVTSLPQDCVIYITEKAHGTSQRVGCVEVPRALKWYEKLAQRLGIKVQETEHKLVVGTRRTVLNSEINATSYYGNETFRFNAIRGISLRKGEILYGELVGYTTEGKPIMTPQNTAKLGKEFVKLYGETMTYTYGNAVGECTFYVYRITQDGIDLSHLQVMRRAKELGLNVVPLLQVMATDNKRDVDAVVEQLTSGASTIDSSHIREGVVIRIESPDGVQFYKNKSTDFGILEGYLSDKGIVDRENVS